MASEKGSRKDKNQNIQVFVRLRPLNQREKDIRSLGVIEVVNGREVIVRQSNQTSHNKKFTFDRAFPPQSKQVEVYQEVVSPLIEEVLAGYNCTVFAYGQTGTGKTHTMVGEAASSETTWQNDPQAGIIPRALSQLFDELRLTNTEYTVRVSYLELYNEELFDLLSTSEDNSKLRIYEDVTRKGSNIVNGLEEITVYNKNEVYKIMAQGQERKRVASTLMNAQSSNQCKDKTKVFRSHTVFTIVVHMKENSAEGEELVKVGKLNLVDLAGSENISKAGSDNPGKRERARECVNINQSLLTLGRVITALVERHPHIPYRESKLTRILQESLGGRTKTSIIATISPGHKDLEETMSTLDYANRAKNIQNKPEINQKMTKKAIFKEYAEEIDRLKRDLQAARDKNGVYLANETYTELTFKQEEQRKEIQELILKKRAMEEERERAEKMFSELNGQLFAERQRREETYSQLCHTENRLADTHNMLEQTKQSFEEQQHLVEKQQQTERELAAQARRLLLAAELAAGDAGCLHDSVDKRRSVETTNLEVTRTYREMSAQHREAAAAGARQHHAGLRAALLDLHRAAETFTNEHCDTLTQNQQKLEEILQLEKETSDKVERSAQQATEALAAAAEAGRRRAAAAAEAQRAAGRAALAAPARCLAACLQRAADLDVCSDLDKFLQYWVSDASARLAALGAAAGRWARGSREAAGRQAAGARRLADGLRLARAAFAGRVAERLALITEEKNDTERRISWQLSNIEAEKSELEASLSSWAERERRELEQRIQNYVTTQRQILEQRHAERMKEIEDEQRCFEKKVDSYVQWLNDIKAENEKEIEKVVLELEESEKEMLRHREITESLHMECEKGAAGAAAACGELGVNALKIVQHAKDNLDGCVRGAQQYIHDETTKAIDMNEEKMSELTSELSGVLDAQAHACQEAVTSLAQEIHSATAESGAALAAAAARSGRAAAAARAQLGAQHAALERLQRDAARAADATAADLARLDQLERRCLHEQYRVYSPTGKTPGRKEYQFPRNLVATSPHDRILARFRALRHSQACRDGQDGQDCQDCQDRQDYQDRQNDSVTTINSDSDSTESEDSAVAIQTASPQSPPSPPAPTAPPAPHPAPIVKCTSESDIFAHRKVIQGKENMNRSMTFKKPTKLPALSARKTTPLLDKN